MIDVISLLSDYSIPYSTTHHHCTPGWVNIHCPFCTGKQNFHLGIHLKTQACNCWRCGTHSFVSVVAACLDVGYGEAKKIITKYASSSASYILQLYQKDEKKLGAGKLVLPAGLLTDLTPIQRRYLESRGFDVEELQMLWDIKGIGPIGSYKYRIFIPIIYNNQIVSFQTRATGDGIKPKYKACAKENELLHHKYLLYGYDYVESDKVIVVEGPLDVWKIGFGAVALFGIKYTLLQTLLLSQFKHVYIMLDDEKVAYKSAKMLAYEIELLGVENVSIVTKYGASDPGELNKKQVEKIREKLLH